MLVVTFLLKPYKMQWRLHNTALIFISADEEVVAYFLPRGHFDSEIDNNMSIDNIFAYFFNIGIWLYVCSHKEPSVLYY